MAASESATIQSNWYAIPIELSLDWPAIAEKQAFEVHPDHRSIRKAAELTGLPWARILKGHAWVTIGTWDIEPNAGVPHAKQRPGRQLEVSYSAANEVLGKTIEAWLVGQNCEFIASYER